MDYYLKFIAHQASDAHRGGSGTLLDPFLVADGSDGTDDLDAILNGTYPGSTAAVSGDVYHFTDKSHDWGALVLNNAGIDGIRFVSDTLLGNTLTMGGTNRLAGPSSSTTGKYWIERFYVTSTAINMTNRMEIRWVNCKYLHTNGNYCYSTSSSKRNDWYRSLLLINSSYTHYWRYINIGLFNSGVISLQEYSPGTPNLIRNGQLNIQDSYIVQFEDAQQLDIIGTSGSLHPNSARNYTWNCNGDLGAARIADTNLHFRQGRAITEQALPTDDFRWRPNSPLNSAGLLIHDPYAE